MRAHLRLPAACALAAASLAGCASRGGPDMDRTGMAMQSAARQTYNGVGEAITTPLRDLNLTRKEAPVILLAATDSPYQTRTVFDCSSIAGEVAQLDLALGPDLDTPRDERNNDYYRIGAEEAADAALEAVRDAAEGIVPVRGWVRRLTGAQRNDKRVKEAIYAGSVRRAFLKGLGESRGCPHPAAPLPETYGLGPDRAPTLESAATTTVVVPATPLPAPAAPPPAPIALPSAQPAFAPPAG